MIDVALITVAVVAARAPPPSPPPQPILAASPLDVVSRAASGYAATAILCGGWTGLTKRSASAAWSSAQRWGRVSAGFSGGQAAGEVIRGANDRYARLLGACGAGVLGATSMADIPSNVLGYVAFTYLLEAFEARAASPAQIDGTVIKSCSSSNGDLVASGRKLGGRMHKRLLIGTSYCGG